MSEFDAPSAREGPRAAANFAEQVADEDGPRAAADAVEEFLDQR